MKHEYEYGIWIWVEQLYGFQKCQTISYFGDSILSGKITKNEADEKQRNILNNTLEFNDKARRKSKADKKWKRDTYESVNALHEGRELTLNAFRSRIFPIKPTQGKKLKLLSSKQMLQRLPIALHK